MTTYAYARTSTLDQVAGLAAQERDLRAAGAERIISEQVSSVTQRDGLDKCLGLLKDGDVLMVTKIDRLARGTIGQLQMIETLTARGVGVVILAMFGGERMDTRSPTSKLILTVMAGVATYEREVMLERQKEGIAKAKADGKFKGRKPKIDPEQVRARVLAVGPDAAALELGVHRSSVFRALKHAA